MAAVLGLDEADEGNFPVGLLHDVLRPDGEWDAGQADPNLAFITITFGNERSVSGEKRLAIWYGRYRGDDHG